MATVTKTVTEDTYSSYKSTWTVKATGQNVQATGTTISFPALTIKATYVYSGKSMAYSSIWGDIFINGASAGDRYYYRGTEGSTQDVISTVSGTEYTIPYNSGSTSIATSSIFNSSNPTTRTVDVTASLDLHLASCATGNTKFNSYAHEVSFGTVGTVTLGAPPTFDVSALGKDTAGYYKDATVVSVTVSNAQAKYGGGISSVVFNVGDQSTGAPSAGTFYIRLGAVGTFTPSVTVTDTRGQASTKQLPTITVGYAPPSCTPTVSTSAPYINNYSAYSVNITNASAGDGSISSIKLTVGGQTATRTNNGTLTINPTTNGTFTPTVVITNSYGVSTSYTLAQITVQDPPPPSFNVSATTSAPYVRTKNSYAVSITNATAYYGDTITSTKLTVGNQSVTGTVSSGSGTLTISSLNSAGTYTPTVTLTDNRGLTTMKALSAISVLDYNVPSMTASVIRCNSSGTAQDEGTYAKVTTTFNYSKARCNLKKPSMTVRNQSGTAVSTTQTWYTDNALTSAVNWTNYNPNSPVTLYCLVSGSFTEQAYSFSCYVEDSLNGRSGTISLTMPATFFTIDYQAGGKEIAFGAPANDSLTNYPDGLFKCEMTALINDSLTATGDITSSAGLLKSTKNGNTVTIGSQNSSWCHIYNTANIPFIFNNSVATTGGDLGTSTYKWGNIYSSGTLYGNKADFSGAVEMRYIDLHASSGGASDYDCRLTTNAGSNTGEGFLHINNQPMKDFITERGTSSSWYYRKWNSGKVEAWRTYNAGSQTPSKWTDYMYYKDLDITIPSGIFSATPNHTVATCNGSDYQFMVFVARATSATNIRVRVVKPNSGGATPVIALYVSNMV